MDGLRSSKVYNMGSIIDNRGGNKQVASGLLDRHPLSELGGAIIGSLISHEHEHVQKIQALFLAGHKLGLVRLQSVEGQLGCDVHNAWT